MSESALSLSGDLHCGGIARDAIGSVVLLRAPNVTAGNCNLSIGLTPAELATGSAADYTVVVEYLTSTP